MDKAVKVIVAAAGLGRRMNSKINKPYMLIKGRPVLAYSLDILDAFPAVTEIVVVANFAEIEYCQEEIIRKYAYKKVTAIIPGAGKTGFGLERPDGLGNQEGWWHHDGARPFRPCFATGIAAGSQEVRRPGYGLDTLKVGFRSLGDEYSDRSKIMAVQHPRSLTCPCS